jgi:hypothetical protein
VVSHTKGERRLWVSENRVLLRTFGFKRENVVRHWRRLHNEKLRYLYASPNIIRVIKSRRVRWVGNVAGMGRREMHIKFWSDYTANFW